MDKKMTLEQIESELRRCVSSGHTINLFSCQRMADAIDAELKARGEPVAIVGPDDVIWLKDEACEVDVLLYTAPPAPKIEVTDAMVERAQDTLENTTRSIGHHHMRRLLEAALKEAP